MERLPDVEIEKGGLHIYENGSGHFRVMDDDGTDIPPGVSWPTYEDAAMNAESYLAGRWFAGGQYQALRKAQLMACARHLDIEVTTGMTKADLVRLISRVGRGEPVNLAELTVSEVKECSGVALREALTWAVPGNHADLDDKIVLKMAVGYVRGGLRGYVRGGTLCPMCGRLVKVQHVEVGQYARVLCTHCRYRGKRAAVEGMSSGCSS
jgi:hypothetical protein